MDQIQLKQKIAEYFGKLPKEAQIVFSSMVWMETLKNIGIKYNLNETQLEILGTETTLVLLGIIHIEEYQKILETELGLEKEIIENIIIEIDENILKTIKGQLTETFELNAMSLVDQRFINMPKEDQEAIAASNWEDRLYGIGLKYKLTVEQLGLLEEITIKVMTNEIHPDQYQSEIASKITISKEDLSNLISDINEKILKTIRELLKKQNSGELEQVDDEIPLPPYSKVTIKIEEKPKVIEQTKPADDILRTTETTIDTEVEKPAQPRFEPVSIPKNIIEEKLKGATASNHNVSDHSSPIVDTPSISNPHDPYREVF